jgi:hypothetical protein
VNYEGFFPFEHWWELLKSVENKPGFFWTLLLSSGFGATIGGVTTEAYQRVIIHATVALEGSNQSYSHSFQSSYYHK